MVDLDGALVTPAFVDAHVHATDTGLALAGLDLSTVRSRAEVLDAVAAPRDGLPADAVVLGHGWDESTWADRGPPDAAELDRAAGGRLVYLSQASTSTRRWRRRALLRRVPRAGGRRATTRRLAAARRAPRGAGDVAFGSITAAQRRAAQRAALRRGRGAGHRRRARVRRPADVGDEADFTGLLALVGRAAACPRCTATGAS